MRLSFVPMAGAERFEDQADLPPLDFAALLSVLRRRWPWLLVPPLLLGGLAVSRFLSTPPVYTAATTVFFPGSAGQSELGGAAAERAINNEAAMAMSAEVVDEVAARVGPAVSVAAAGSSEANLVIIEGRAAQPDLAARAADVASEVFLERRARPGAEATATALAELAASVARLQPLLADIDRRIAEDLASQLALAPQVRPTIARGLAGERDALLIQQRAYERMRGTVAQNASQAAPAVIAQRAVVPRSPSSPSLLMPLLAAVVVGTVLGLGLVTLRERLDGSVRQPADLRRLRPGLGLLDDGRVSKRRKAQPPWDIAEVHRNILGAVLLGGARAPGKVVQVCGLVLGSAPTSVALGVALAASERGLRVLLVDAVVSRPRVARLLDLPNDRGLTSLAVGFTPLEVPLQRSPRHPALGVLTAGPDGIDAPDLSINEVLRDLVDWLSTAVDLIVIDSPPAALSGDALALSSWAAATVLVVTPGRGRSGQLDVTLRLLQEADANVLGAAVVPTQGPRRRRRRLAASRRRSTHRRTRPATNRDVETAVAGAPALRGDGARQRPWRP